MEIDEITNVLKLVLGNNDIRTLETSPYSSSWVQLVFKENLIRGFRLLPVGPCIVAEYDVSPFSYNDRDTKAYGFLMYIKHTIEQVFECVPFICPDSKDCIKVSIVGFKSLGGLNGDRGSKEYTQVSIS